MIGCHDLDGPGYPIAAAERRAVEIGTGLSHEHEVVLPQP
jgi:hypothetical protein